MGNAIHRREPRLAQRAQDVERKRPRRGEFQTLSAIDVADLARRVAAIEADQRDLRGTLTRLIAATSSRRPPVDDLSFLTAVAGVIRDRQVFSARELLNHGIVDPDLRAVIAGSTTKAIGKRLRRLTNQRVGPFLVRWSHRDDHGNLWTLDIIND